MTNPDGAASVSGDVLRAVAALLLTLGQEGGTRSVAGEPKAPHHAPSPLSYAPPAVRAPLLAARADGDFAAAIEEAREQAQHVLDEGIARARALARPPAGNTAAWAGTVTSGDPAAAQQFDELRRSIALMSDDLQNLQQRVAQIELFLGAGPRPPEAGGPVKAARASLALRIDAVPSHIDAPSPLPSIPANPRQWADMPPGLPLSAVPPMRARATAPPIAPHTASGSSGVPRVTFIPEDGGVRIRVSPVAGFRGLMRLQDALGSLRGIRQAVVEAYSLGDASLRLELAEVTGSDEIADGLAGTLSVRVEVRDASEADRSILIILGNQADDETHGNPKSA